MNVLLISFGLTNEVVYDNVVKTLHSFEHWARVTEYTWIVKTSNDIAATRSKVVSAMGNKGPVLVIDVAGREWGTFDVLTEVTNWMKNVL